MLFMVYQEVEDLVLESVIGVRRSYLERGGMDKQTSTKVEVSRTQLSVAS